jgi:1,4-alpha-glucan branching enzyme
MGSQPDHKVAFSALINACAYTVIDVEKQLDEQKESDAAEVRRQEEEKRQKEQMGWLAAEQEEKDRLDRVRKMAEEREAIAAAERDLEAKKEALCITQKAADMDGDDEDDEDDDDEGSDDQGSESAAEEAQVRDPLFSICSHYNNQSY